MERVQPPASRHARPPPHAAQRFARSATVTDAAARALGGVHAGLWLRPIGARDEAALQRLFARLTPVEIRRRFLYSVRELPPGAALRLCTPDGVHEQAWVIAGSAAAGAGELHGVGRMFADPVCRSAEFALLVERSHAGRGLGRRLLQQLLAFARANDLNELWSHVAGDNQAMLALARGHDGSLTPVAGDPGVVQVRIPVPAA